MPIPHSLVDIAEQEIRKRIISGELGPGQKVTESELSRLFGMSKTPVHEALQHLQRERLVQVIPRQGTFIFTFTAEQIRDLLGVRVLLETHAIGEAVRKNRGRLLRGLGENIKRSEKVLEDGKIQPYLALDQEFHNLFFRYADNMFLNAAFSAISIKLLVIWRQTLADASYTIEDMRQSIGDHRNIAESLLADHLEPIREILVVHVNRTKKPV